MKKITLILSLIFSIFTIIASAQTINFTTPGTSTWTVPAGVSSISIYCWGGGGGGGGASYGANTSNTWSFTGVGKGGGSGGFNKVINYSVVPGQVLNVTVGAGGQYNTVVYNTSGSGGDSFVKNASNLNIVSAGGGTGASGSAYQTSPTNGIGGSPNGANGTLNNYGGTSVCNSTAPYACPGGGTGGIGAAIPTTISAVNGGNGSVRGGGGGGGAVKDDYNGTMLSAHGGNGGNGMVIIFVSKIDLTATSLQWGCLAVNSTCPTKIFQLTGYLLNSQIVVKPPTGYMVSTTSNFASFGTNSSPLNIPVSGPSQTQQINTPIYVKLESTSTQAQYAGSIEISCPGMSAVTSKYVSLNAVVGTIPNSTINYSGPTTVCSGNQIALSVDSVAGLFYQWKNNNININGANNSIFNVVNAGNYSVSVTNSNGCTSTSNGIQIVVNPLPTSIISSTSPIEYCTGNLILNDLTVSLNQNYQWNTGESSQAITVNQAGTYSVVVTDANGCQNSDSIQITVNPLPSVLAGNDKTTCQGQGVTLNASGAVTYAWNNGVTNNTAFTPANSNTYIVVGTDANGCQDSDTVIVTVNQLPNVIAVNDQTTCNGQSVTLNATGASTFTWNNNVVNNIAFTPSASNTYIVIGTDVNGCQDSDTVNVTVNQNTTSQISQTSTNSYTLNGQTYSQSGTYTQIIPNANGCDSTITLNLIINNTNGLKEFTNQIFSIYPNPTTEIITIDFNKEPINTDYILFDISGRSLISGTLIDSKTEINLSKLSSGTYYIRIFNNNVKLVKQ